MENNQLSKNFTIRSMLQFTLPTILTFLFMSTYTIVDGIFVANLVGEDALAAVNIIVPVFSIAMAVALMFATGGNAIISKLMGEGKNYEANRFLSVIYIIGGTLGLALTIVGFAFPEQIARGLGANEALIGYAVDYLKSLAGFSIPIFFLMNTQTFLITAGKPTFSLIICVIGGLSNMILDYVFIAPNMCNLGIVGAGLATGIGNTIPAIIGLGYFIFARKGTLYLSKPNFNLKNIFQSMYNGSSELVGNLSSAITVVLFNSILLAIAGENGVAAISAIMYIQMFQTAIYFGYTVGVSPIIGYNYGAQNKKELHNVVKISFIIITAASVLVILFSTVFAKFAIGIFISPDSETFPMAVKGLLLFVPSFLFMGYNVFYSALFTSLSNGKVSAILSFIRTLVFMVGSLLIMPAIFGLNGVWLAVPVAELLSILVGIILYKKYKNKYGY